MAQKWGQVTTGTSDQGQVTSHIGTSTKWSLVPKTSHPIGFEIESTTFGKRLLSNVVSYCMSMKQIKWKQLGRSSLHRI